MHRSTSLSWILLIAAIAMIALAGYAAATIQSTAFTRAEEVQTEAQQLDRKAYAARLTAIAADTKDEREELEQFLRLDIVATAEEFERVGARAGIKVSVTDATPDQGTSLPGGGTLRWVTFSIVAEGSYEALMRAASLYESLPYAQEVTLFDLQKNGGTAGGWHLTLRIRVLAINDTI